jgi:putative hydrolase of the HAD superfamily
MTTARLARTDLGSRVVVRYLIEDGARATDVIGILVHRDHATLAVKTADGTVDIPVDAVVAGKPVPAAPRRRPR